MRPLKLLVTAALASALALAVTAVGTAQGEGKVVLTVGLTQDLDSPNVTVGELVSSYELYTLQYAALTDKAAADFETIPVSPSPGRPTTDSRGVSSSERA